MSKYQDLVNCFVGDLERGVRPWSKSWRDSAAGFSPMRPLRANGTPYRGMNVLALWMASMDRGFTSPHWMTYKQAGEIGAQVRHGAKAAFVFYYGTLEKENDQGDKSLARFVKTYCVFNASEIDGLPEKFQPVSEIVAVTPEARIENAESYARNTGAVIRHGGNAAFYSRAADFVQMPEFSQFNTPQDYYATLFHELTHWTGAETRVERPKGARFGDSVYAMEELVAELGAAFLCADLGISDIPREDHSRYLANWANALKAQPSILMSAASAAEKAVDYMNAQQPSALSESVAA